MHKLILIPVACFAAATASAAFFQNSTGLSSPVSTITFDEFVFAASTPLTNQYSSLGVTFSSGVSYDSQGGSPSFPGVSGHYAGNNGGSITNPVSILFTSAQTDVAVGIGTNPTTTTFTALLGGSVVDTQTVSTDFSTPGLAYIGWTGTVLDEIRMTVGGDQQILFDNIQTGNPVPEPMTMAVLGLGAAALLRRRRKSA